MATARTSLPPAAQLLFLMAAVRPSDAATRRLMSAEIDWREFCALAERENAAPVVLRHLGRLGSDALGSGYRDLRQLAAVSVMRMLQLEQLLRRALDHLSEQGIDAMLLKGAGLAHTVYSSFADRPMGDLDLLIRPQHAEAAWSLLQTRGWIWPSTRWSAGRYKAHQHLPPLIREPGGFRLEIHEDVLPNGHPFRFSADTLWARAHQVYRNGRALTIPHPVHQLWHVCVHFAWSHELQWGAWRAFRDSAAIIDGGTVAWAEFVDLARESRAGTCCYWTLRLARRLVGGDVPDGVLAALRPPRPEAVLDHLERHYVSNLYPSPHGCPSVWLSRRLWEAGVSPGWSGHGSLRPWHVTQRMLAGARENDGTHPHPHPHPRPRLTKLPNFASWWAYGRRIRRFVLPVAAPVTTTPGVPS